MLIAIGALGHPSVAVGGFHSQAGWIAFNAVGLGLVAGSRALGLFAAGDRHGEDEVPYANTRDPVSLARRWRWLGSRR